MDAGSGTRFDHVNMISVVSDIEVLRVDPADGVGLKIWECYANLPAQLWDHIGGNRIVIENTSTSSLVSHWCICIADTLVIRLLS